MTRRRSSCEEFTPLKTNWIQGHNHLFQVTIDMATFQKFLKISRANDRTPSGELRAIVLEDVDNG